MPRQVEDQFLARFLISFASFSICCTFFTSEIESVEFESVFSTSLLSSAAISYSLATSSLICFRFSRSTAVRSGVLGSSEPGEPGLRPFGYGRGSRDGLGNCKLTRSGAVTKTPKELAIAISMPRLDFVIADPFEHRARQLLDLDPFRGFRKPGGQCESRRRFEKQNRPFAI